jgi:hypothetical protein
MNAEGPARFSRRDDPAVTDPEDTAAWLSFTRTRAGRRQERQELLRARLRAAGATGAALLLAVGLFAWSPWSSGRDSDTGDTALGSRRATVLLGVQGRDGAALLAGLLVHDRVDRRGGVVVVPPEVRLPVSGEGRIEVAQALRRAGPTLTREAIGDAVGVAVDGSWVLPADEFARFVDRLGGVEVAVDETVARSGRPVVRAGQRRLSGEQAIAYATYLGPGEEQSRRSERTEQVLRALASAVPETFVGTRAVLHSLGVLGDVGLSVDRLAAVLSGLSRDASARRLGAGTLPVDEAGHGLDVAAAGPLVRDLLGGRPRTSLGDVTPRVMVQLRSADAGLAAEVRATLVGAGYEYVDGGTAPAGEGSVVTVRAGTTDAIPVGEAVALTLGLDRRDVTTSADLPVLADVLVVLGADFAS